MLFVEKYGRGTWRLRLAEEHRVALRAGSGGGKGSQLPDLEGVEAGDAVPPRAPATLPALPASPRGSPATVPS